LILRTGGGCYPTGASGIVMVTDNTAVTDVECEVGLDVMTVPGGANQYAAAGVRMSNSSLIWNTTWMNWPGFDRLGGYDTALANYTFRLQLSETPPFAEYPVGQYTLKHTIRGTLVRTFLDRREVFRRQSGIAANGRFGIITGGAATSTTGTHFTHFRATNDFDTNQIQFVGDSMVRGDYTADAVPTVLNVGEDVQWPAQTMALLEAKGFVADWANLGVSAQTAQEIDTYANQTLTTANGIPHRVIDTGTSRGWGSRSCRRTAATHDMIVLMAGINDLRAGASAATVISRLEGLVDDYVADGFTVVGMTIPECDEAGDLIPAGFNAAVATINAAILANSDLAGVIDVASDPLLGDYENTTYRSEFDALHWTPFAQARVASMAYAVMAPLLGISTGSPAFIGSGFGSFFGDG